MTSTMAGYSTISPRVMASSFEMQNTSLKSYTCFACHRTKHFRLARNAKISAACISRKKQSKLLRNIVRCEAYAGNCRNRERYQYYNLYELLGIDAKASPQDIKQAYRWLQKRCHPDVAGEVGHDMAILLNEAYATLSDSQKRAAYDEMVAETKDFEDYTGKPLYSRWMGPASEDRAVFVDEIKCIGCLKCALIAPSTFSIENGFGRARAVAQWGDSEDTIKDAIKACPVDCIWWVERSKLPALEFIMSKQPRIVARADGSSSGVRVADVFTAVEKFLKKSTEYQEKQENQEETFAQREARMMAAEAIQARAGRWWHLIMGNRKLWENSQCSTEWNLNDPRAAQGAIVPLSRLMSTRETSTGTPRKKRFSVPPKELAALFEAAAKRRLGKSMEIADRMDEEYWTPTERISCPVSFNMPTSNTKSYSGRKVYEETYEENSWADSVKADNGLSVWLNRVMSTVPLIVAMVAAILVGFTSRPDAAFSKMDIVGPMPTEVSSSTALQAVLAAAVWYAVAAATSRLLWLITTLLIGSTKKNS
ncbi:hypothetical protein O6H91_15G080300 [Diphasiastrum complanatum]|uniref:Uncharacterized protein n=2 Tax=Diphasiastrum complanatum TaxID=34168 RepID=A0ACC2BL39_DIPCM|nr:hypothetical protein O6H91_15G080300 [Diphasiastrum complanatum]KAJ7530132.1 hypothetical protein O6H91_15G080300 [Diphasiastrum complanatum]